jgi:hypothetical protein
MATNDEALAEIGDMLTNPRVPISGALAETLEQDDQTTKDLVSRTIVASSTVPLDGNCRTQKSSRGRRTRPSLSNSPPKTFDWRAGELGPGLT